MHKALAHNPLPFITLAACTLLLALPLSTSAETMQGTTYQVRGGTFGTGGTGSASSETYQQSGAFGEALTGEEGTSESYQSSGGEAQTRGGGTATSSSPSPSSPPAQQPQDQPTGGGGILGLFGQINNSPESTSINGDTPSTDNRTPSSDLPASDTPANNNTGIDNIATAISALGEGLFGDTTPEHVTNTQERDTHSTFREQSPNDPLHPTPPTPFTLFDWLLFAFVIFILFFLLFWKRRKDTEEEQRKHRSDT